MDSDDYDDYNDYDNYNDYEDYNDYNNNYDSDSNNFDEFNDFCDGNSNQEEYSNNNYDNSNDIDSVYDSEYDYNNYVKQQTIKQVKTQTNNKESLKTQIKNTTQQGKLQTENGDMQHLKKDQNKIDQKILNETIKSLTLKFTVSNAEEMIFKIEKRLGIKRDQFMHGNPNISLKKLKDQKDEKQQQNERQGQQVLQFQVIEKYKEPIKRYFWQQLDRAQKDPSNKQQTIQESIKFTVSNASVTIKNYQSISIANKRGWGYQIFLPQILANKSQLLKLLAKQLQGLNGFLRTKLNKLINLNKITIYYKYLIQVKLLIQYVKRLVSLNMQYYHVNIQLTNLKMDFIICKFGLIIILVNKYYKQLRLNLFKILKSNNSHQQN
ncbi:Hypothetical_protein [Hexamita inflata]|uniref:Hypothetical_protein n=1 Tax=Hexamita inflata TaxID=28002 RepID=A0AA86NDB8_9EUKA|nr:Hypothetical protein HINF_LOCUS4856 [Hexamita inflata]